MRFAMIFCSKSAKSVDFGVWKCCRFYKCYFVFSVQSYVNPRKIYKIDGEFVFFFFLNIKELNLPVKSMLLPNAF